MTAVDLSAPDSKKGKLQRACLALLQKHEREGTVPTNVTFLFYELEQRGVVPKHYLDAAGSKRPRTPRQDTSDATLRLRELGLVPWWWLVDESRKLTTWRYAASAYDYVAESVERVRIDCWRGEPPPLVLCESRATAGVLDGIASHYLTPISGTGGQCGGHLVNKAVPLLVGNERKVLYLGDCESVVRAIRSRPTRGATSRSTRGEPSRTRRGSRLRSPPSRSRAVHACVV